MSLPRTRWATRGGFAALIRDLGSQAQDDIAWAESIKPPVSARAFALETIYVICNSGMKNTVARGIYTRVCAALGEGKSAHTAFKHKGKAAAIDHVWQKRDFLYGKFMALKPERRLDFLATLPWIGGITKYHLAKNFGVDCCKPDVHLQRLAAHAECSPEWLCEHIAKREGLRVATVDTILWRACAVGLIDSKTGIRRPIATGTTQHSREKHQGCECCS